MPLLLFLAAPGSQRCFLASSLRVPSFAVHTWHISSSTQLLLHKHHSKACTHRQWTNVTAIAPASSLHAWPPRPRLEPTSRLSQCRHITNEPGPWNAMALDKTEHDEEFGAVSPVEPGQGSAGLTSPAKIRYQSYPRENKQRIEKSRTRLRAQRQSQPGRLLEATGLTTQGLYAITPRRKMDVSYTKSRRRNPIFGSRHSDYSPERILTIPQVAQPVSLYTIMTRYARAIELTPRGEPDFSFTARESELLARCKVSESDIKNWTRSLWTENADAVASLYADGQSDPPLFILNIFLRRKHISALALGTILRYIDGRLQETPASWETVRILVIRLMRHARVVWPGLIPLISELFTTEANRIYEDAMKEGKLRVRFLSDFTYFCNAFLSLISLPTSLQPILSSRFQQTAQFEVLRLMASQTPAIAVTQTGFRAVVQVQLAHHKTREEREWAVMKGLSWPPWKQARNAMDEEKGYEFGASRASRIMHRMYEAGYAPEPWESVAGLYAGWDVDLSPTIQTRTSLPTMSVHTKSRDRLQYLLWAARIRATRTVREAWACFLACESAQVAPSQEVYSAMFEKLHHTPRQEDNSTKPSNAESLDYHEDGLLPGDMKEVLPEPSSPLTLVNIAEPVPSFEQLYHRMTATKIKPRNHFLAFLLQSSPDFSLTLEILDAAKDLYEGELQSLVDASIFSKDSAGLSVLPDYILAAFVGVLCRFGRYLAPPNISSATVSITNHGHELRTNSQYLLDYALALLLHLKPRYRPVWTAYMTKLMTKTWHLRMYRHIPRLPMIRQYQYEMMHELIPVMQRECIELDQDQFTLFCQMTRTTAQNLRNGQLPASMGDHLARTGRPQLRRLFYNLVSSHLPDTPSTPEHTKDLKTHLPSRVPSPNTMLHYVLALGTLHDYEGLYSFALWAHKSREEITDSAKAHRLGMYTWRRIIVALRSGLEGISEREMRAPASRELIELVRELINAVEEWGGWPTDEEIDEYTQGRYFSVER